MGEKHPAVVHRKGSTYTHPKSGKQVVQPPTKTTVYRTPKAGAADELRAANLNDVSAPSRKAVLGVVVDNNGCAVDLSQANALEGFNFDGWDFSEVNLRDIRGVRNSSFRGAVFGDAAMTHILFEHCDFTGASFENQQMWGLRFKECNLNKVELRNCAIDDAVFENCSLKNSLIEGGKIVNLELRENALDCLTIRDIVIVDSLLSDSHLDYDSYVDELDQRAESCHDKLYVWENEKFPLEAARITFENVNFVGSNITEMRLNRTTFTECDFEGSSFIDVIAHGVDFSTSSFSDFTFRFVNAEKANFSGKKKWRNVQVEHLHQPETSWRSGEERVTNFSGCDFSGKKMELTQIRGPVNLLGVNWSGAVVGELKVFTSAHYANDAQKLAAPVYEKRTLGEVAASHGTDEDTLLVYVWSGLITPLHNRTFQPHPHGDLSEVHIPPWENEAIKTENIL